MNENIVRCWEQGTKTVVPRDGDYSSVSKDNIQQFAELIIAECTESVRQVHRDESNTLSWIDVDKIQQRIKTYFGVNQ
jgi:chemotaxis signal transduction protein